MESLITIVFYCVSVMYLFAVGLSLYMAKGFREGFINEEKKKFDSWIVALFYHLSTLIYFGLLVTVGYLLYILHE